jgi:hypothetical protein
MQHRTARKMDGFDRRFAEVIEPILRSQNFAESAPYRFTRVSPEGEDVIYFEIYSDCFYVRVAYRPSYMDEVESLIPMPVSFDKLGFFKYLTPICFENRPRKFPIKSSEACEKSMHLVERGLTEHAFQMLSHLKRPGIYADWTSLDSPLYYARAHEFAGAYTRAKEGYDEVLRRLLLCWNLGSLRDFLQFRGAREFVYVCLKLDCEKTKRSQVMEGLGYYPNIEKMK